MKTTVYHGDIAIDGQAIADSIDDDMDKGAVLSGYRSAGAGT